MESLRNLKLTGKGFNMERIKPPLVVEKPANYEKISKMSRFRTAPAALWSTNVNKAYGLVHDPQYVSTSKRAACFIYLKSPTRKFAYWVITCLDQHFSINFGSALKGK